MPADGGWAYVEVTNVENEDDKAYLDWMGKPTFHQTFGPGSLEDINLERWAAAGGGPGQARVSGTFKVYCGNGQEHTFEVESGIIPTDVFEDYLANATAVDPDTDREYAVHSIVDEIISEEWSDPCEIEITPTCDLCGEQWEDGGEGEDWNGETGNHFTCEAEAKAK